MTDNISKQHKFLQEGLDVFGKISAGLSHDINNILAAINENAGIIQDVCTLTENLDKSNFDRIAGYCGRISNQTQKGVDLIKSFNYFAHSIDEAEKSFSVNDILSTLENLCKRFATLKGINLDVKPLQDDLVMHGFPFGNFHAMYICLDYLINLTGKDGCISLSYTAVEKSLKIILAGAPIVIDAGDRPKPESLDEMMATMKGKAEALYYPNLKRLEFSLNFTKSCS
jgi:hypothetical protein